MTSSAPGPDNAHLRNLYPFLHGQRQDLKSQQKGLLDSIQGKVAHHQQVIGAFFEKNAEAVLGAARALADVYRRHGRLLCMGNGGSSCDAGHIAVEFLHPVTAGRPALPAIDLSADRAMLTAVGNDVGFANIFVRQVIAHGRPGDGLIGISTSGNSANLVKAFAKAREMGLTTIGLTGIGGGEMSKMGLDHCLVVEADSIHRIQECHLVIYHVLWDLVHSLLADDRGDLSSASEAACSVPNQD
ncbi:MAG: SIS domain-containing protein [Planctomycetota bacterium]|nr:SIS domain-containing protein [Planctomycetota bacterium]MDA2986104.1 SIS domain-containing protein [Actinomycetota bacterium]